MIDAEMETASIFMLSFKKIRAIKENRRGWYLERRRVEASFFQRYLMIGLCLCTKRKRQ